MVIPAPPLLPQSQDQTPILLDTHVLPPPPTLSLPIPPLRPMSLPLKWLTIPNPLSFPQGLIQASLLGNATSETTLQHVSPLFISYWLLPGH